MEDPSIISGATTNHSCDISDSNSCSTPRHAKLNPKAVVVQPNSHWLKTEREATATYDSPTHNRNFPWTHHTLREPSIQSQLTADAVLSRIRDSSYTAKSEDYARAHDKTALYNQATALHWCPWGGGGQLQQLFQKELTPSDVSKLNRLVIPKRYAVKYFPRIEDAMGNDVRGGGDVEDLELTFFDRSMRSWKLRYCYWKSSQSYVFTRGWNSFAKEKGLKPKDRVIFSSYESGEENLRIIDVGYCEEAPEMKMVGLGGGSGEGMEQLENAVGETKVNGIPSTPVESETKGIRLFGFQIV